jgi:succinoglycan biosynthesis transport protein ExoP
MGFFAQLDLLELIRIGYRHWPVISFIAVLFSVLGAAYSIITPPRYTATFSILVDPQKTQVFQQEMSGGDHLLDPGLVDSQLEILKSESVLRAVVRKLKLTDSEDFTAPHGLLANTVANLKSAIFNSLPSLFVAGLGGKAPAAEDPEIAVAATLESNLRIKRVGLSYVIDVSYTDFDPREAALIANEIADAYTVGELEARYRAAQRTGTWLQDRIRDVGVQATEADAAVQKYKADHNIIDTSRGLITEQRLADVNSQLVAASAATAEAKARLDRIVEVARGDIGNAAVADTLHSDVITRLRAQYLDLSAKESDYSGRFGKDHASVQEIRNQMAALQRTAHDELHRIVEATKSDYSIAQAREASLKDNLAALISQQGRSNEALGKLRNLESTAQTYRNLYDTMLQKAEEASRQQNFPVAADRLISPATAPVSPSWPKLIIVLPASIFFGIVLGYSVALLMELLTNTFRTNNDVFDYIGFECLGIIPKLPRMPRGRALPGAARGGRLVLGAETPISRYAVAAPFSRFSEIFRNVKVSIDLCRAKGEGAVTGIVSSVPHEGKTTFCSNFALLAAQMGDKTILIDGDLHRQSLTKVLTPNASLGILDVLNGSAKLASVIFKDEITGLHFLANPAGAKQANAVTLLTSSAMAELIAELRRTYDYVIFDLPPVIPVVDVKASASMFDHFVFVVQWGATSRDVVRDAMIGAEEVRQRTVGVVLNMADPNALKRIESYKGYGYGAYYTSENAG